MTAPGAVPDGTTVAELAEALLVGAEGDRPREAAIDLLARHNGTGHWLGRQHFRACVTWWPGWPADEVYTAVASVDWSAVASMLKSGLRDSPSEVAVLGVALSLAVGPLYEAAALCDARNRGLILDAVDDAL